MNEKGKKSSSSKKKGFYVALYGTVAVLLSLAVAVSYNNTQINKLEKGGITANIDPVASPKENDANMPDSSGYNYLSPEDRVDPQNAGIMSVPDNKTAKAWDSSASANEKMFYEYGESAPVSASKDKPVTSPEPSEPPKQNDMDDEMGNSGINQTPITAYTEDAPMDWPVLGEVVMGFSPEHGIFDQTLEQYRTNYNICIAAQEGTEVRAAAEGFVISVITSRENGNQVVLDHGNGWETTYTQLQDNILVKEGDVVRKGQIIGGIGKPSIYGVMLGSHLGFEVTKDSEPVDPLSVLVKLD